MNKLSKTTLRDLLYVSKITNVGRKKILITTSVILSQATAFTDVTIISIFAYIISGEITDISFINKYLDLILKFKFTLPIFVIIRFILMYFQRSILKNIELNVSKNLRVHILEQIINKKNYSTPDSFFYINSLTTHISFFYSNFANLLNMLLQMVVYTAYLLFTDLQTISIFGFAIVFVTIPITFILKKSREFMHESYIQGQVLNRKLHRIIENLFLIKLLKMDNYEVENFSTTVNTLNYFQLQNFRYGIFNNILPNFFALFLLSLILSFATFADIITLVFMGVTLRLFQSFSGVSSAANSVINSQVHIEQFYKMENDKVSNFKNSYKLTESNFIKLENVSFQYFNSDKPIFENINISIEKNKHTVITGQNGTGKSTLLGLISGVYYPTEGTISSFSNEFAYIGASPYILPSTIRENLMYGNHNEIDDVTLINYLKEIEVFKEKSNYDLDKEISNENLSSGQMQKIAFIRAILSNAKILLLDEATANLDKKTKSEIFNLISKKDLTIINSTHLEEDFENIDSFIRINIEAEKRILNTENV